ncbi:MAG TPA: trypsin-like peptidase domain-containing protein [Candidatus Acidoferrales bacterium]|nr:trypsin-like peptidase domain-containing protein [Candidatus Acidoferrales bacterium]
MKLLRPFLWAAVLAGAFLYVTSVANWDMGRALQPVRNLTHSWSEPATAATATGYSSDEQNNIDVYKASREATVYITSTVYREDFFFRVYPAEGTGSGFIINPEGEILTNNHVVSGNAQLTVTLADKKVYKAKVLGVDARNDLALIRIDAGKKLPALHLGDSDHLVVGQKVLAIGNPFQFQGTLTTGIVSSLDRTIQTEDSPRLEGMIQTDAAINPGNSGGPLLDSHGSVIGINTAILGQQGSIGIGFAMPIARAKAMLEEFQAHGKISRPTLGIQTVYVAGDLAEMLKLPTHGGLLIQSVERNSAAAEAGLRGPNRLAVVGNYEFGIGGDLITAADGQTIESNDTMPRLLSKKRGGDMLELTIYRGGHAQKVKVKLGEAPQQL